MQISEDRITREQLLKEYAEGRRDFSRGNLKGINLSGADLDDADLRGADLEGATIFRNYKLTKIEEKKND